MYPFVVAIFGIVTSAALAPRWSASQRTLFLVPLLVAFSLLYVSVSAELAQDRDQYYQWYQGAHRLAEDPGSGDRPFSVMLKLLPSRLSPQGFGAIMSAAVFTQLLAFLLLLAKRRVISWDHVLLVAVVVIADRLFLDLTLNTTRSSISGLFFLLGLLPRIGIPRLVLWSAAIGVHALFGLLLLGTYGLSVLLRRSPLLLRAALLVGVAVFLLRMIADVTILPQAVFLDLALADTESQRVLRGLTTVGHLTSSLGIQILLAVIVPAMLLLLCHPLIRNGWEAIRRSAHADLRERLVAFAITGAFVTLVVYPDFALSKRLFLVAVVGLPLFVPLRHLAWLAPAKVALIAAILPAYLD
jgi:hypothetical protein